MQELCKIRTKSIKSIRVTLFFFFFLIISMIVSGADECRGTISQDDIPCLAFLPRNSTTLNCDDVRIDFFLNDSFLYRQTMDNYTGSQCNATFNSSMLGTYLISYSTGDTGSIVVVEGIKMILLFYFTLAVLIVLIGLGIWFREPVLSGLGAIGLFVFGLHLHINGFSTVNNVLVQYLAILFIGLGVIFFIPTFQWAVDEINLTS